jgi:hypothetical protein
MHMMPNVNRARLEQFYPSNLREMSQAAAAMR